MKIIQKLAEFFIWLDRWGICPRCKCYGLRSANYGFRYEYCKRCEKEYWKYVRDQRIFDEDFR